MNFFQRIVLIVAAAVVAASCGNKKDEPQPLAKRTLLVYMVATNSMSGQDATDIAEMKAALASYAKSDCRLLLYRASYNYDPQLIELRYNSAEKATATITLKTYDSTPSLSVTKQRFMEVMADAQTFAPAHDYGLVLWSHAAGWASTLPKSSTGKKPRYFGIDYSATMPIDSLADALPGNVFSFIYADACYMGGIEVAYELRNKTHYLIASPAEMPYDGIPYDVTVPLFFEDVVDIPRICDKVYDFYKSTSSGLTLSVVDCTQLDALADVCRAIHSSAKQLESTAGLQYYNRATLTGTRIFYDFGQYTRLIATDESLIDSFNDALERAIIYKVATPKIFGITVNPDTYSGLSTSIYGRNSQDNDALYSTLQWYRAIHN